MQTENGHGIVLPRAWSILLLFPFAAVTLIGCGAAGGSSSGSSSPAPSPAPTVSVSVSPATAKLYFGQQQQFTATVTGTANTAVTWAVNGVAGGDAALGAISAQGLYTAPAVLHSPATVSISATSEADSSAGATASVTLESDIQVTISPATASVTAGATQSFTAQVTGSGTPDTSVNWSLTGSACSGNCGTLTTSGNTATFTAPATVPSAPTVSVVATSVADPTKSATAEITITAVQTCSPAISLSPTSASLALGAQQSFTAKLCSGPGQTVTWTIGGSGCTGSNCGTVTGTGAETATYTAPASMPPTNPVMLVATSSADPSESASASIAIAASCSPAISVSPSASTVALGQQESFTATVCFTTDSSVTWRISGAGCSSANCGTVSSTGANTATYVAPGSIPPTNPVTVVATSVADASQSASATVTLVSGVSVALNTVAAEVAAGLRFSLSASVQGTANQAVSWAVDGLANGDTALGRICEAGSNPCAPPAGAMAGAVDYLAPATVPNPPGVYVTATAAADISRSATAEMTVLPHLVLSLAPADSVVAPSGTVEFAATVTGTSNDGVTWQASCAGSDCGTISSNGVYTAPATAPNPNAIVVTATSTADPTQSATATVALTSGVALSGLAPAGVTAGAADGFTLALTGYNFAPTVPGPGTTLLVDGTARTTTCASSTACTVAIAAADVASPGNIAIQAQNPDGTRSNSLPLVVVPADGPATVVSLSPSDPVAGAEDIVAVQPTADGAGTGPMTVIFLGLVDPSTDTCNVTESPVELARPSSGTASYTICLGGAALDPSFGYALVGSQATGVSVSNPQWFDGSLVAITVTISSSAAPGPRTLFVTDPNENRAAASGAIDVE